MFVVFLLLLNFAFPPSKYNYTSFCCICLSVGLSPLRKAQCLGLIDCYGQDGYRSEVTHHFIETYLIKMNQFPCIIDIANKSFKKPIK